METLDRLKNLGDQEIQDWLRKVRLEDLITALVGADLAVTQAVSRNLSPRARALLAADVAQRESRPPTASERDRAVRTVLQLL